MDSMYWNTHYFSGAMLKHQKAAYSIDDAIVYINSQDFFSKNQEWFKYKKLIYCF